MSRDERDVFLPVAPRPGNGEFLSSWRGRVACRYGVAGDKLAIDPGAAPTDGFVSECADGDFAPDSEWLRVWATACRLEEGVLHALALSRVSPWRESWMWAGDAGTGTLRAAVCLACLAADAEVGDHFIRADWLKVESFVCRRHARLLRDVCAHCLGGEGWRYRLCGLSARLACVRCHRVLQGERVAGDSGFVAALGGLSDGLRSLVDGRLPLAAEVLDAARRFWLPPSLQAWVDRAAPLLSLPLGWRTATLIAVAQILDIGAPAFGLARLKEWTQASPLEREPRVRASTPVLAAARERARYRAMAEAILASDDWRQRRERSPAKRRRLLGRLTVQALDPAPPVPNGAPGPAATSRKTPPTGGRRAGSARALSPVAPRSRAG